MFRALIAALLIFCAASACFAGRQEVKEATCKIWTGYKEQERNLVTGKLETVEKWYTGTGFVYRNLDKGTFIITAGHVVDGEPFKIEVQFTGRNEKITARRVWYVYKGEYDDVAIISVSRDDLPDPPEPILLASPAHKVGKDEDVWTFGYGNGKAGEFESKVLSTGRDYIQTTRVVEKGRSGSCLYDEDLDRCVGIVIRTDGISVSMSHVWDLIGWDKPKAIRKIK